MNRVTASFVGDIYERGSHDAHTTNSKDICFDILIVSFCKSYSLSQLTETVTNV
jgi:hypothetical protein